MRRHIEGAEGRTDGRGGRGGTQASHAVSSCPALFHPQMSILESIHVSSRPTGEVELNQLSGGAAEGRWKALRRPKEKKAENN